MTNQDHFVVELDESIHEADGHIKISYKSLAWIGAAILLLVLAAAGALTGSLQLLWKASQFEKLQADFERVRGRNKALESDKLKSERQMSQLEGVAKTVSQVYGLDSLSSPTANDLRPMDEDDNSSASIKESIQEFNILKAASFSHIYHHYAHQFQTKVQPSIWPVNGVIRSSFGRRSDPFSGESAVHAGVDLSASIGTPVKVTADGVVEIVTSAGGRYGHLVVVDHGGGLLTYYGHLSQFLVVPGQEVRRGEVVALSGASGRVTGPHLHYEIRLHGTPVNPYNYLGLKTETIAGNGGKAHNDLGL
jgi:murein DD-endopeptidase MepM/ murein hydrolase activator NlpD